MPRWVGCRRNEKMAFHFYVMQNDDAKKKNEVTFLMYTKNGLLIAIFAFSKNIVCKDNS